eukprot:scaffold26906_cov32-Tisochrysis_lutea.AAC.5
MCSAIPLTRRSTRLTDLRFLGRPVSRAVVCVPAYFGQPERAATLTACKLAGIRRISLLREPEAAALGYALDEQRKAEAKAADQRAMASATRVEAKVEGSLHRVMVFDLGGGTFDVTIVDIGVGKNPVSWFGNGFVRNVPK